jgi:hypothetical protein
MHNDCNTIGGEPSRDRAANAARGAGDDRGTVGWFCHKNISLLVEQEDSAG